MLMRRRGVHSGLVVKVLDTSISLFDEIIDQELNLLIRIQGEEGALSMTTRLRPPNASKGLPVNYCSGFRSLNVTSNSAMDGSYLLSS